MRRLLYLVVVLGLLFFKKSDLICLISKVMGVNLSVFVVIMHLLVCVCSDQNGLRQVYSSQNEYL